MVKKFLNLKPTNQFNLLHLPVNVNTGFSHIPNNKSKAVKCG